MSTTVQMTVETNDISVPMSVETTDTTIPMGFDTVVKTPKVMTINHLGAAYAILDPNLIPENIRRGVTIYGITGTFEGE